VTLCRGGTEGGDRGAGRGTGGSYRAAPAFLPQPQSLPRSCRLGTRAVAALGARGSRALGLGAVARGRVGAGAVLGLWAVAAVRAAAARPHGGWAVAWRCCMAAAWTRTCSTAAASPAVTVKTAPPVWSASWPWRPSPPAPRRRRVRKGQPRSSRARRPAAGISVTAAGVAAVRVRAAPPSIGATESLAPRLEGTGRVRPPGGGGAVSLRAVLAVLLGARSR